ncbi:MAG: malonyl-ACP O-methyltransferase BioC [Gammaproteobacteria bacterium]|nr:malonyl-ACP O-methyltransferase BioC [Gammaproteobacteria bacterium]
MPEFISNSENFALESQQVRRAFDKAARDYDAAAVLQREIADRLLERLEYMRISPEHILDLGAGTGYCSRGLAAKYPSATIYAADIAPAMLRYAKGSLSWLRKFKKRDKFIVTDANSLAFADNSMDIIFSNLTLQWCPQLEQVFKELKRVLKPGGMLLFSTFGPDTLKELRNSWLKVDDNIHVNHFIDLHDVGDAMLQAGFSDPVMDMEMITVTYKDVKSIMRDLKQIGAHNVNQGRARALTGKGRLLKLQQEYEVYRSQGVLPVSHEVIYGNAWCAENKNSQPQTNKPEARSEFYISIDAIGKQK